MTGTTRGQTVITVIHSPGCHFCEDARRALVELSSTYPLAVELVEAADPRGEAMIAAHRPPLFPLVLVDGAFFSFGRLPRKKLTKMLDQRRAQAAA